jgi:penicillin-binding protein 1C
LLIAEEGAAFRPHDYDRRYHGQVSLRQALGSSLNIPALRLALSLSPASVLDYLRALNFPLYQNPSHYGPGLALGNGEVDLLTLTNAYATLAEGGLYKPVRRHKEQEESAPRRVLDPRAAYLIAPVLADDEARALGFGRHGVLQLPFAAAVKTGTSQHHRDNWCVGFSSEYTVGVWSGDFSGQPMQQVSGVSGAAPLWRQIMLMLHHQRPGSLPPVPPGISTAKVCLDSGLSAHAQCPRQGEELIMTPLAECGLHGAQNPNRPAPALWLDLPARNGVYILDPDVPAQFQALHCRLRGADDAPAVSWRLDGEPLAGDGQKNLRLPLRPGRHLLEVRQGEQSLRIPYLVR